MAWISFPKSFCCLSAGATTVVPLVPAASPSRRSNPPLPLPLPSLSQFTALAMLHLPSTCILASRSHVSGTKSLLREKSKLLCHPCGQRSPRGFMEHWCFLASDALSLGIGYAGSSQSTCIHWAPKRTQCMQGMGNTKQVYCMKTVSQRTVEDQAEEAVEAFNRDN